MSEKPLLLSADLGGRAGSRERIIRMILAVVGALIVLFGAANMLSRLAETAFGAGADAAAFAPAITLDAAPGATSTPLTPARLIIPAIGVNAAVEQAGQKADGSMATPSTFGDVAWYKLGSAPGAAGNAVIAGHVNNALTEAGVFEHLDDVKLGDVIEVADAQGRTLRFAVRDIEDYPSDEAPDTVFATSGPAQLVLITCAGDWDPQARSFDHRLVIYAGLLPS